MASLAAVSCEGSVVSNFAMSDGTSRSTCVSQPASGSDVELCECAIAVVRKTNSSVVAMRIVCGVTGEFAPQHSGDVATLANC